METVLPWEELVHAPGPVETGPHVWLLDVLGARDIGEDF